VQKNIEEMRAPDRGTIEAGDLARVYHLVYYSTSLLPGLDDGGRQQIDAILDVAMQRNAANGVTGALAFNEFSFAQVLEGSYEAVKATFAGIAKDPRHTRIAVLQEGWTDARDFAQWAMAYVEDEASVKMISPQPHLQDVLSKERQKAALALIEMMKFWLLHSA
jgi:hypothetical protein